MSSGARPWIIALDSQGEAGMVSTVWPSSSLLGITAAKMSAQTGFSLLPTHTAVRGSLFHLVHAPVSCDHNCDLQRMESNSEQ